MVDPEDPRGIASVWQQAAAKVSALRRDPHGEDAAPWNQAIDRAVGLLAQEAADVRAMGRMAYLLIVGNVSPAPVEKDPHS
jgi:hypothetical protein